MAINTSRTPRKTDEFLKLSTSTTDLVAPGRYEEQREKVVQESAVPFCSLQEKNICAPGSTAMLTPGPGAYLGQELPEGLPGGDALSGAGIAQTSFKSRAKRLGPTAPGSTPFAVSSVEKNPGPGSYSVGHNLGEKSAPEPKAALRPVLDVQDKTIPSMPPTRFLPGQKPETEAAKADLGSMFCRHTGEPHDMAGPGEYDPKGEEIVRKNDAHTIFHPPSKKSGETSLWEPSCAIECTLAPHDIPGPGTYSEKLPEDTVGTRGATHKFNSTVPMAHEAEVPAKRIVPGPGAYEIPAELDRIATLGGDRHRFGSVTDRVGWARDVNQPFMDAYNIRNVPGPGHYPDVNATFKDSKKKAEAEKVLPGAIKKKLHGVHHPTIILALQQSEAPLQAFNSTDDRPCNKDTEQSTPAPGQYVRENALGASMMSTLKERAKVGRKGIFGTCADRFFGSPLDGRKGLPDPSFDGAGQCMTDGHTGPDTKAPFTSGTSRIPDSAGPREAQATKVGGFQTPAPGSYNVTEPTYQSPYRTPRQDHLSFGSARTRFTEKQDLFSKFQLPASNPPPGIYDPSTPRRVKGTTQFNDCRKTPHVGCTSDKVGPGSYGEDGHTHTTLNKRTFNVSTQAPLSARPADRSAA